jgi:hypothetical protein
MATVGRMPEVTEKVAVSSQQWSEAIAQEDGEHKESRARVWIPKFVRMKSETVRRHAARALSLLISILTISPGNVIVPPLR